MDLAAQRMTALLAALRDAGVADDDLRTSGLNLWHDQHERRFVANHTVTASLPAQGVGAAIDAAADAARDEFSLNGVSFSVADPEAVVAPLRPQALADARAKAEALAAAEGASVGAVLSITEGGAGGHVPVLKAREMRAMATPVEIGSESLTLQVTATFELR